MVVIQFSIVRNIEKRKTSKNTLKDINTAKYHNFNFYNTDAAPLNIFKLIYIKFYVIVTSLKKNY